MPSVSVGAGGRNQGGVAVSVLATNATLLPPRAPSCSSVMVKAIALSRAELPGAGASRGLPRGHQTNCKLCQHNWHSRSQCAYYV